MGSKALPVMGDLSVLVRIRRTSKSNIEGKTALALLLNSYPQNQPWLSIAKGGNHLMEGLSGVARALLSKENIQLQSRLPGEWSATL